MRNAHSRPWHRNSVFGPGYRVPLCRERRAVWKARMEIHRRSGRITADHVCVGSALLRRLGQDGRCDPSIETLATDSGESVSTVQRALKALYNCGLVTWVRRLWRDGSRVKQISNAYMLTDGSPSQVRPAFRCDKQRDQPTIKEALSRISAAEVVAAQAALERRRKAFEESLLKTGISGTLYKHVSNPPV